MKISHFKTERENKGKSIIKIVPNSSSVSEESYEELVIVIILIIWSFIFSSTKKI